MIYDEKYYESGVENCVSGYQNYRWIPEVSLKIVHHLIVELDLNPNLAILDYGCAKGFLVKAFHIFGYSQAFGVDISKYAIDNSDSLVKSKCFHIERVEDVSRFAPPTGFDLVILKDVLEHIPEGEITFILRWLRKNCERIFIAVPLGIDDVSNRFVIPAYHNDVTHITIKSRDFWLKTLQNSGWSILDVTFNFPGIKSNWTMLYPDGNLFVVGG